MSMKLVTDKRWSMESQADPYVIQAEGKFYMYATGSFGVAVYRSDELMSGWEKIGVVASVDGYKGFWAPSVIELEGTYYMYVSFMPKDSDDSHDQTMHVFTSSSPEGPFINPRKIAEPFSIDSHVVKNENGLFLFYSINDYDAAKSGTYIVVDRLLDPFTLEGKPVSVIRPTLIEELWAKDRFEKGKDWYTIEGAFYFRKDDYHYVLYSGNCFENEYYFVGYAYAHTKESDLTKIKFQKYPADDVYKPLLAKNDYEEGTGHNSVIEHDGEFYAVYHGRDWDKNGTEKYGDRRDARICRLDIDKEKITAVRK